MKTMSALVLCLVGCAGEKSCPDDQYLSGSGDCEDRQDGGSANNGGGSGGGSGGGDDTGVIDTGGGDDTGGGGSDLAANADWGSAGLLLTVVGGEVDAYYTFGMAETGADEGWMGEDCLFGSGGYYYCHSFEGSGLRLETVGAPDDVESGVSTLFSADNEDDLSYILIDYYGGSCWVWGDDPSYYTSYYGCTVL